jgi:hypothetical protein
VVGLDTGVQVVLSASLPVAVEQARPAGVPASTTATDRSRSTRRIIELAVDPRPAVLRAGVGSARDARGVEPIRFTVTREDRRHTRRLAVRSSTLIIVGA